MIVFTFPGQGSQFPGMAGRFYEEGSHIDMLKYVHVTETGETLFDLVTDMNSRADILTRTQYAQPALYAVSFAGFLMLKDYLSQEFKQEFSPGIFMGHSLGQLTAVSAAGFLEPEKVFDIVMERSRLMAKFMEGLPKDPDQAYMAFLRSGEVDGISSIVENVGNVFVSHINSSTQIGISGRPDELEAAYNRLKEAGYVIRMYPNIGTIGHVPLLENLSQEFSGYLDKFDFAAGHPIVGNVSCRRLETPAEVKEELVIQLSSQLNWHGSISCIIEDYDRTLFIEIGPGNVLTKNLQRDVKSYFPEHKNIDYIAFNSADKLGSVKEKIERYYGR